MSTFVVAGRRRYQSGLLKATAIVSPKKRQTRADEHGRELEAPLAGSHARRDERDRERRQDQAERVPREPDQADEDGDRGEEAGDRLRCPPRPEPSWRISPRRSTVGDPIGARSGDARGARVGPGGASVRPWRPAARAPAKTVEARRRRVRDHANPGRASASPRLRLDRIPNHVAEICDGDLEDHHEEDELPERVRRLHCL